MATNVGIGSLTLRGTIAEEPRPRGERQQVVLDEVSVVEDGAAGASRALDGRLLVRLLGESIGDGTKVELRVCVAKQEQWEMAQKSVGCLSQSESAEPSAVYHPRQVSEMAMRSFWACG